MTLVGKDKCEKQVVKIMRVKYIGKHDTPAIDKGKIYDVISIEKCWYRIMTELDEDYLFPPEEFQVIEDENSISIGESHEHEQIFMRSSD